MRLVEGDVTRLEDSQVGSGYRLLLDTGTFHGLKSSEQAAMGRSVTAVATADATDSGRSAAESWDTTTIDTSGRVLIARGPGRRGAPPGTRRPKPAAAAGGGVAGAAP